MIQLTREGVRHPPIRDPDQDLMRNVGYPKGKGGGLGNIHGLFGCKPLALTNRSTYSMLSRDRNLSHKHTSFPDMDDRRGHM